MRSRGVSLVDSPKQVALEEIIGKIQQEDVSGVDEVTEMYLDFWDVAKAQKDLRDERTEIKDSNSIDALIAVKKKTDKIDKYLIYEFGVEGTTTDVLRNRDFIFKTSKVTAEIGIQMDINNSLDTNQSPPHQELAFLDGKHGRVGGFVSLGLWVFHPTARKILHLASMEMRSERTESIALFLTLWNQVLAEVKGQPGYKFNLCSIVCDNAGAMENAVKSVLGVDFISEGCFATCRWHYKSDMLKKENWLTIPEDRDIYKAVIEGISASMTVAEFNHFHDQLQEFLQEITMSWRTQLCGGLHAKTTCSLLLWETEFPVSISQKWGMLDGAREILAKLSGLYLKILHPCSCKISNWVCFWRI